MSEENETLDTVKQSIRAAVREGWEECRAIQAANGHDKGYVLGSRSGSNTVAMYVYRALHDVRALKPAPVQPVPSELMHLVPIGPGTTDVAFRERAYSEGYWEKVGTFQMDRANKLEAEVERLAKVVADQALTIGALKDENARLRSQNDRSLAALTPSDHVTPRELAELKRFREREEKVTELLENASAERYFEAAEAHLQERRRLVAAVRDFKVEAKPATRAELALQKYGPLVQAQWEWYESQAYYIKQIKALYGANTDETDVLEAVNVLIDWEKANPKPHGGEL